jgi:putative flippase GtrA
MGPRTRTLRRVSGEAAKFSLVNVVATLVALVAFNALIHGFTGLYTPGPMHDHPLSSYLIANSIGMILSFSGSKRFAFRNREPSGPGGGLLNFVVINLSSFTVPIACLWVSRNAFGWDTVLSDNVSANVVGGALGGLLRFWAFRTFVFKRRTTEDVACEGTRLIGPVAVEYTPLDLDEESAGPEVGPDEAELVEHQPQEGEADPHHVVRVPGDAGDEGATEPVEGEGPRDV